MKTLKETILHLIANVPFFDCFNDEERSIILKKGSWIKALPGNRIVTAGQVDFSLFILVVGQVQVTMNEKVMAVLNSGDIFGEVGLMGIPRTANVKAQTECLILSLDSDRLNDLTMKLQLKFVKRILLFMVARLQKINQHERPRHQARKIDECPGSSTKNKSIGDSEIS